MRKERLPWWMWLNRTLLPYLGPPELGPYDEPEQPESATKACPLCGGVMSEHNLDRKPGRPTYLTCPA